MRTSKHSGEKKGLAKGGGKRGFAKRMQRSAKTGVTNLMAELRERVSESNTWHDPDDAPPLTKEFFERADVYRGNKLVRAGRPPSANPKLALKLRIDPDIVEHFRATGPGWQTRINDTLRKAVRLPTRRYSA
jgi:uncharacterized protein (DUF4415 family)